MFEKTEINREKIGKRLRDVRNEKGLTQVRVAEDLGLQGKKSRISKFEHGNINRLDQIEMFARYYKVSAAYLLFGSEYDTKHKRKDKMYREDITDNAEHAGTEEESEKSFFAESPLNLHENNTLWRFVDEDDAFSSKIDAIEEDCKKKGFRIANFVSGENSVSFYEKNFTIDQDSIRLVAIEFDEYLISYGAIIKKADLENRKIVSFLSEPKHDDSIFSDMQFLFEYLTEQSIKTIKNEDLLSLDDDALLLLLSFTDPVRCIFEHHSTLIAAETYFEPGIAANVIPMTDSAFIVDDIPQEKILIKDTRENMKAAASFGYKIHREAENSVEAYKNAFGTLKIAKITS